MKQERILIAALSLNRVIGINNHLPWELPADWENFKRVTKGYPFIMGRKSYESPDMLFSEVNNVVLSRQKNYPLSDKFVHAQNLREAFDILKNWDRVFILGGEKVFEASISYASHLYLTEVQVELEGDAFFPEFDRSEWELRVSQHHPQDARHAHAFYINEYERK